MLVNTYAVGDQTHPSVTGLGRNRYVVVWNSDGQDGSGNGVYGQVFVRPDTRMGSEFPVNTTVGGDQQRPDVAAFADGTFVVAWESDDGGDRAFMVQRFGAAGQRLGKETAVNTAGVGVRPAWVAGAGPSVCEG